jgi:hypothetical protein
MKCENCDSSYGTLVYTAQNNESHVLCVNCKDILDFFEERFENTLDTPSD